MPVLIAAGIGAVGSIVKGLIGGAGAKAAGKTVSSAGMAINQQLNGIATTGDTNITNSTAAGQGLISQGQAGVGAATGAGQGYVNSALGTVGNLYNTQTGNLQPYLNTGSQAASALGAALGPGGSLSTTYSLPTAADVANTPGYQFQLQQGEQAVQRAAAATGSLGGGGTAKSLDQYSQGLASTYYQQAVNNSLQAYQTNYQNTYNTLMGATGVGQNASGQLNQASQTYGNQTLQGNQFNASLGLQGATTQAGLGVNSAQLGLSGTQAAANYDLQGAQAADYYYMQGQEGYAAGQAGQANAYGNAVNGATQAIGGGMQLNSLINSGYGLMPMGMQSPMNQGIYNSMVSSPYLG